MLFPCSTKLGMGNSFLIAVVVPFDYGIWLQSPTYRLFSLLNWSPENGLFAGGIIFAVGLHLGGEKCDLKSVRSHHLSCRCRQICSQNLRSRSLGRHMDLKWTWIISGTPWHMGGARTAKKGSCLVWDISCSFNKSTWCWKLEVTMGAAKGFLPSVGYFMLLQ